MATDAEKILDRVQEIVTQLEGHIAERCAVLSKERNWPHLFDLVALMHTLRNEHPRELPDAIDGAELALIEMAANVNWASPETAQTKDQVELLIELSQEYEVLTGRR
jgi:hypothetical protein